MRLGALFMVLASLILLVAPQALAERRVALVIGNADYKTATLKNPVNDERT